MGSPKVFGFVLFIDVFVSGLLMFLFVMICVILLTFVVWLVLIV